MISERMTEIWGWPVKRSFAMRADGVHWRMQMPTVPNQEGLAATLEEAENAAVAAAKAVIEDLPAFEFVDVAHGVDGTPHSYRARFFILDESAPVYLEVEGLSAPITSNLKQSILRGRGADPREGVMQAIRTFADRVVRGEVIPD